MIVKDESHIIEETLKKLTNIIDFDYWVISDTGSTDGTQDIITKFFRDKNIPGELFNDQWKDFGYNRTLALYEAYKKTEYLLIFDADDEIKGQFRLPDKLIMDGYSLNLGNENFSYSRVLLINNKLKWKFNGVLHEYLSRNNNQKFTTSKINGDYFVVSGKTGNRSNNKDKYYSDALILQKAYYSAKENNDPLFNRYVFYCANSYFDAKMKDKAVEYYLLTLSENGWTEEKYISCLKLAEIYSEKDNKESAMYYSVKSYSYNSKRVEGIFNVIKHYCILGENVLANHYYQLIKDYFENEYLTDDLNNKLFTVNDIYSFYLPYYMIIVSEKIKDFSTSIKMYLIIFEKGQTADNWWINNLIYNLQYCYFRIQNIKSFIRKFKNYLSSINFSDTTHSDLLDKYFLIK
jgi:hypothetical protein